MTTVTITEGGRLAGVDFEEFVAARSPALLRTAYLLTRDHAAAEDLLQTALAKAWSAWGRIDGHHEPYVRRILVNTYSSWWRRRWRGEHTTENLPETETADFADHTGDRSDLWAALGRLSRRQRTVVVLRFFEDLSVARTAQALGCSQGTVKSTTNKAMARLRIDPALVDGRDDGQRGDGLGETG